MTAELQFPGKCFQSMMAMRESRQRGVAARLTSIGVRTILLGLLTLLCYRTQAQVAADFAITSITLSPTNPERGQAFNASVTVKNQGSGPGDAGWLDLWTHQPSSQACGADGSQTRWVGLLAGGSARTLTFKGLIAPASVAPWTFRAFVDSNCATIESNETNNQATASYGKSALLPDLVINSVSITPTNPQCGQSFSASITIKNQGNGAGDAGWLDLWTHQPSSQACGAAGNQTRLVGLLAGGGSRTLTVNGLIAPATGAPWTFRAFIDSTCATSESNESNNQASLSYGRCDQLPDLVVTSISLSPPTPRCAQLFKASVTVRNQGRVTANGGWLDIWKNGIETAGCGGDGDSWQPVGVLAPGQSRTYTFPGLSAPTNGTPWTFRAVVDSACAVTENSESNNQLTKTYGECLPEPDFLISALSVSPSVVRPGVRFTAYVSLENQGSAAGDAGWVDVWVDLSKSAKCGDNGGAYQRAGTLLPGAKKTLTFTSLLCGPATGLSNVLAFVDSGCATAERIENNNQLTLVYSSPTNSLKQTARLEELTDSTQKDAVVEPNLSTAASATPPKPTRGRVGRGADQPQSPTTDRLVPRHAGLTPGPRTARPGPARAREGGRYDIGQRVGSAIRGGYFRHRTGELGGCLETPTKRPLCPRVGGHPEPEIRGVRRRSSWTGGGGYSRHHRRPRRGESPVGPSLDPARRVAQPALCVHRPRVQSGVTPPAGIGRERANPRCHALLALGGPASFVELRLRTSGPHSEPVDDAGGPRLEHSSRSGEQPVQAVITDANNQSEPRSGLK